MEEKNKIRYIKLAAALLLAGLLAAVQIVNPQFCRNFLLLVTSGDLQSLIEYISSFGAWAILVSFLLDVLVNSLGFLPSIFLSTANGLLFGIPMGVVISWLAETTGVVISFFLMRGFLRSAAEKIIEKSDSLQKIDDFSGRNGFKLMLIARTMPYFPSGILTALGAVSSISVRDYIIANLIGKLPSTALEVIIGHDIVNYQKNLDRLAAVVVTSTIIYAVIWRYQKRKHK